MSDPNQQKDAACGGKGRFSCTIWCVCICATICFVVCRFVPRSQSPRRLWLPVLVESNGNQTILGATRQFEFWTPSVKTKEYLHKEGDKVVATEQWEVLPSDDAISQFGSVLHSNQNILGYRRVEVAGQGRTTFKPGWWWTVNVMTNYSAGDMGRMYQAFWKSGSTVFIEVIDNRGRND